MHIEANEELIKPDSLNRQSIESGNLFEDWLNSSSIDSPERPSSIQTIIVNSIAQSYQEMFQNIYLESDHANKPNLESTNSYQIASTVQSIYSPKENSSSLLENKELSRTFYASIAEQQHESENSEEIKQFMCQKCEKFMVPIVSMKPKEISFWGGITSLFRQFKCCTGTESVNSYYEYAYFCAFCKNEVGSV